MSFSSSPSALKGQQFLYLEQQATVGTLRGKIAELTRKMTDKETERRIRNERLQSVLDSTPRARGWCASSFANARLGFAMAVNATRPVYGPAFQCFRIHHRRALFDVFMEETLLPRELIEIILCLLDHDTEHLAVMETVFTRACAQKAHDCIDVVDKRPVDNTDWYKMWTRARPDPYTGASRPGAVTTTMTRVSSSFS